MIRLADVVHGKNNSFHLLRLAAGIGVLWSHSFPLATGDKLSEPWRTWLGMTPGGLAVDLFFLISGLLVTASLIRRNSTIDFISARFLRIWPGLLAALLITVLILGPAFTTNSVTDYFSMKDTWRYLVQNAYLLRGIDYYLPGVFATNPYPSAINGSLWTLPTEVKCYLYLLIIWWVVCRVKMGQHLRYIAAIILLVNFVAYLYSLKHGSIEDSRARLFFFFAAGSALYFFQARVTLRWQWLLASIVAIAASTFDVRVFGVVYVLLLPYVMICLAYLPRGAILRFNRFGDYSYGTYIYAFPVQQSLMHLLPRLETVPLFLISLVVTLIIAVISWHYLEKPATEMSKRLRLARDPGMRPSTS